MRLNHSSLRLRLLSVAGALAVLLALIAGALALHASTKFRGGKAQATATPLPGYAAGIPGRGCDKGDARWSATQPVTVTCARDGVQLAMPRDDDSLQGITFHPAHDAIPLSYRVAYTGTMMRGDDNLRMVLTLHEQQPGAQVFEVATDGFWSIYRLDTNGHVGRSLSVGFLPQPLATMTLSAEVDGAVMHFALNGQPLATVTDPSYLSTASILIGMHDPLRTAPFAVRLSNFSYTPLPSPALSTSAAVATATAQANQQAATPYRAATPGNGCDHGGAQWSPMRISGDGATTLTCTSVGMRLAHTHYTGYIGQEQFYWLDGNFPKNYSVATDITFTDVNGECGTIIVRRVELAGYSFRVCTNGFWGISHYDASGMVTDVNDGTTAPKLHYTVEVTAIDEAINLAIDGVQVGGVIAPSSDTQTDFITLALDVGSSGGVGNATYSNFVFTPLLVK